LKPEHPLGGRSTACTIEVLNRVLMSPRRSRVEFRLESAGYGIVGTCLPSRFDHWALYAWLNSSRRRPFRWYAAFERAMGARDFVCVDLTIRRGPSCGIDQIRRSIFCTEGVEADVVVTNGEGDCVHHCRAAKRCSCWVSRHWPFMRKPVFLVNVSDGIAPVTGRNANRRGHRTPSPPLHLRRTS
jgi:hypothetical protein